MSKAVEDYAVRKAIMSEIEAGIEYGADKEHIISRITRKFKISEEDVRKLYDMYAAATV